jgi:HD-GYP domain-containing protein (c-di-GMP phosphodiesterase class II)
MSSDRPYRAALGINQAIAQIQLMRGKQLDPDVVDACIRVLGKACSPRICYSRSTGLR